MIFEAYMDETHKWWILHIFLWSIVILGKTVGKSLSKQNVIASSESCLEMGMNCLPYWYGL